MVKQELNIADMLPRNSPQHLFVTQRDKHFSYYAFHMITQYEQDGKVFDYANNQPLLHEYYKRISEVNFYDFTFSCVYIIFDAEMFDNAAELILCLLVTEMVSGVVRFYIRNPF